MTRVTAAFIEQDGKILIAQRSDEGSQALRWEFPGGKIDSGETPEECLKRELKEELNLDIQVGEKFLTTTFDYPTWTIELLVYRAKITGGEMQLNVHNDVHWVSRNEIEAYDFCPADVELVKKIAAQPVTALGNFLLYGAVVSLVLLLIFAKLAGDLLRNEIIYFDQAVFEIVHFSNNLSIIKLMAWITTLGAPITMGFLAFLIWLYLAVKKEHFWDGTMIFVALLGSWVVNESLKGAFQRARPGIRQLIMAAGYSFPSGHAMVSFSFYGMLAYLLWINTSSKVLRLFLVFSCMLLVFAIGISRIYLGVHYPSDVLAGFAAGGVWLAGCILGLHSIRYYNART